jgi:hypothetical protein
MNNIDKWNKLKSEGKLYSALKDGEPSSIGKKIIGMSYTIIVIVLAIITGILSYVKKKDMKWNIFIPHIIMGTIVGCMWGVYITQYDNLYSGWLFHPWSIIGLDFWQPLEDWLFYPTCGAFFYIVYRLTYNKFKPNNNNVLKITVQFINVGFTLFFLYFGAIAGKTIACTFAIPGIIIIFWQWEAWNVKHYLFMLLFIVFFASIWDWMAVSWLSAIPGMAWAQEWAYRSFDKFGNTYHSRVFLDNSWAWIWNNPIEITPWFGIAGTMYTYSSVLLFEKLLQKRAHEL